MKSWIVVLAFLSTFLLSLTAFAGWKVEKVRDELFDTTTTVVSTIGYGNLHGNRVYLRYAFVIDSNKDITATIRSEWAIFNITKTNNETGTKSVPVLIRFYGISGIEYVEFQVGKDYRLLFAEERETILTMVIYNTSKTRMRFNSGDEDQFDVIFNTKGLRQIIEKVTKKECSRSTECQKLKPRTH